MLEFEDLNNSDLLFVIEVVFTIIKAIAQLSSRRWVRLHLYVGSFIAESAAGIALTALLFMYIVDEGEEKVHWSVFVGAGLIMATELVCVVSEARNVANKARKRFAELENRQVWRALLSWISYLSAIGLCMLHIVLRLATGNLRSSWPPFVTEQRVSYSLLVAVCILLAVLILFSIPSLFFAKRKSLRLFSAVLLFLGAVIAALVIILVRTPSVPGTPALAGYSNLDPISTFLIAIVSALTAVAFWRLPSVSHTSLHLAHVRSFELAAFGATAPTVVICFSDPVAARQVLVTVIPQIGAFTVPLVFSYISLLWRSRKAQPEGDDDLYSVNEEFQMEPMTPVSYGSHP